MFKFLFCISLFFLISCSFLQKNSQENQKDFSLFEVKNGFSLDFYKDRTTAKILQEKNGWVVLNGSYFWLTSSWIPYPAGLWLKNGIILRNLETTDPNLSFVVSYTSSGKNLKIRKNNESQEQIRSCKADKNECFAFQSWPLVLSGNLLQDFGSSWHASETHERTLLWVTKSGKIFFFIFPEKVTLTHVATEISKEALFIDDPLTLINLDGWPSTSYSDEKNLFMQMKNFLFLFSFHKSRYHEVFF